MKIDWNVVMDLVKIIVMIVVVRFVIPWLQAKLGRDKVKALYESIVTFVQAAEMLYPQSGSGETKLSYVLEHVKEKVLELGFEFTEDELRAMVEAVVYGIQPRNALPTIFEAEGAVVYDGD